LRGFLFAYADLPMSPASRPPRVHLTKLLRQTLEEDGYDADDFADCFANWKALGPSGEYSDPYFGKDSEYARPLRDGRRVLRHIHLPPESNPDEVAKWERDFARRTRKTSDTSLIYAHDDRHGYLLIYIVREPNGHAVAEMATRECRELMEQLADVAGAFLHDGKILI